MTQAIHRTYGSWIFGSILLVFFFAVFWLAPESLPSFKQQILAITAALLAGLFGFFLTGNIVLAMNHKETSTTLQATGGIALFVAVLLWWHSPFAPIEIAEISTTKTASTLKENGKTSSTTKTAPPPSGAGIHAGGNLGIQAGSIVQTGNGHIQQGAKIDAKSEKASTRSGDSSISVDKDIIIGPNSTVQTGNGLIQKAD